jgi:hypothetical protein
LKGFEPADNELVIDETNESLTPEGVTCRQGGTTATKLSGKA